VEGGGLEKSSLHSIGSILLSPDRSSGFFCQLIRSEIEMNRLDQISNVLNDVVKYLAAFLLAVMTIIVFLEVLFRYVLNAPLDWSEELSTFTFVWMSLLGASIGLKRNEHPRLDLIVNLFPSKMQRTIVGFYNLGILFLLAVLFVYGARLTVSMKSQLTAALEYSVSFVYAVLPISAAIMFFHLAIQTVGLLLRKNEEKEG
jgi:TRAP-type C4-dicarboxylate transport system permease small subunit